MYLAAYRRQALLLRSKFIILYLGREPAGVDVSPLLVFR